jgi:hypothetical protein
MLKIIAIASTEWLVAWFADWGLQNSWQANNKRQNWAIAVVHAFIYSTPFLFFYLWNPYNPLEASDIVKWLLIWWTHAIIDRLMAARHGFAFTTGIGQTGKQASHQPRFSWPYLGSDAASPNQYCNFDVG